MKTKNFLTAILLLLCTTQLWASDTEVDGIWYNFNSNTKTASVTYRGDSYSSYDNEYSGAVVIPSSVTYKSVTYNVTSIGKTAFYVCTGLTSIEIPNSVTSIGEAAFYSCSSLTSVTIPNSVTSIESSTFYNCSSLTLVTIPNSVTTIGYNAFQNCSGLTSLTIGSSVTTIGGNAFYGCSDLTTVIISNSVTNIEWNAFSNCSGLTSVTIGNHVKNIGEHAFYGCSSLTSVIIPNSVTNIGDYAFLNCSGLTWVTIGNSVTSIGYGAFFGCSELTLVTLNSNAIISIEFSYSSNIGHIFGSQVTEYIIGDDVTSIGACAFDSCSSLTSVTIGNSVTSIGSHAFYACSALTSVTIPNSVKSIGEGVFQNCYGLTSVAIGNSMKYIGDWDFAFCSSLTSVIIPNGATSIGSGAFYGCSNMTSVTISYSVTSIGMMAFKDCTSLTSLTCEAKTPPKLDTNVFNNVNKSIPLYVPSESVELYKTADQWKDFYNIMSNSNSYTIIFLDWDGTMLSQRTANHGETVTAPDGPTRDGYIFTAWSRDLSSVTEDMFVIALYEKDNTNALPVYFVDADGGIVLTAYVTEAVPQAPAWENHTFFDWITEDANLDNGITIRATYTDDMPTETPTVSYQPSVLSPRKVFRDGQIFILMPDNSMYDAHGKRIELHL